MASRLAVSELGNLKETAIYIALISSFSKTKPVTEDILTAPSVRVVPPSLSLCPQGNLWLVFQALQYLFSPWFYSFNYCLYYALYTPCPLKTMAWIIFVKIPLSLVEIVSHHPTFLLSLTEKYFRTIMNCGSIYWLSQRLLGVVSKKGQWERLRFNILGLRYLLIIIEPSIIIVFIQFNYYMVLSSPRPGRFPGWRPLIRNAVQWTAMLRKEQIVSKFK